MPNVSINCLDCRQSFDYTERDQEFYATNGWTPPKRCRACRQDRKAQRDAGGQAVPGTHPHERTPAHEHTSEPERGGERRRDRRR